MEPGAEPEPSRRRERSLTAKRSLLAEYDKADYKARHELLDREQLTIRQISRWRSEVRMAARKKAARRPVAASTTPAKKRATPSRTTTTSQGAKRTSPAAKRTSAAAKRAAVGGDAEEPTAAKSRASNASGRRERPRRSGARNTPPADDDVAVVHAEALIYHTAALDRLLAARSETGPSAAVLTRLRSTVREAHEAAWLFLDQALKPGTERPARTNGGRNRRPWWGADAAPPPPATSASERPKRWGR